MKQYIDVSRLTEKEQAVFARLVENTKARKETKLSKKEIRRIESRLNGQGKPIVITRRADNPIRVYKLENYLRFSGAMRVSMKRRQAEKKQLALA